MTGKRVVMHPGQSEVLRYLFPSDRSGKRMTSVRYACVCASRGFGKSMLAGAAAQLAVDYLQRHVSAGQPNKNVSIVAPTYAQVTDIYWPILAHMLGMEKRAIDSSRSDGFFRFRNDVTLKLWSYEASERMRGTGQFLVIGDEVVTWEGKPGAKESVESIIMPTMTTRWPGNHCGLFISTPKGYDYFHDMYNLQAVEPERWRSFHYDYTRSPYLSKEEIDRVRKTTDPIKFAREYLARFEDSGANVFYCFDRKRNTRNDLAGFSDGEDVHVSIDFNIGIMAATLWGLRSGELHGIGELSGLPDTVALAKRLKLMFPKQRVIAYPDPSGKARKTSAVMGQTDFSILESAGFIVRSRNAHPPIVDSVAAVNAKLRNVDGDASMFLCPVRCPQTIRSLERTQWSESNVNVATIDKRAGEEHFSDGVRYITEYLFPVTNHRSVVGSGFLI
jgi:hypothetical protein